MTDLVEARERLKDAQRRKSEADELISALEQQVLDGQDEVVVLEAGEKYGLQRLAALEQQRAEKQVKAAEAQALEGQRAKTLDDARTELADASVAVIAQKYGAALAALDDLAAVCDAREAAILRYRSLFEQLGMAGNVLAGPPQPALQIDGERLVSGDCKAELMVARVVGRLSRVRSFRGLAKASSLFGSYHPVEVLLAGMTREQARRVEESNSLAQPLLDAARAAKNGGAQL